MTQPSEQIQRGARRAAILLLSLGEEVAVRLMQHLGGEELRAISDAARTLSQVQPEEIEQVLDDFAASMTGPFVGPGGDSYLRSLAIRALGPSRADVLLGPPPKPPSDPDPLTDCVELSPQAVGALLEREHPQITALVMAALSAEHAASVLKLLPEELRVDVIGRLAKLENIKPELVREIGETLLSEVRAMVSGGATMVDGPASAAEVLKRAGVNEEVLQLLSDTDPELAAEIKKRLFTFSDIGSLDGRAIQQILREIDSETITMALKSAPPSVNEKILANMSSRAAEMIREDLIAMGPVRVADVEQAHEAVVAVAVRLSEEGTITIAIGDDVV